MSGPKIFIPILIVLIFFGSLAAEDKSYTISHVNIEAQLNADGSMRVKETRTFNFKGKFSYLYRIFPRTGPVEFQDFKVKEGGIEFQETDSREAGTLFRENDNNNTRLTWFISARNEIRTFQLSYLVQNAVKKYEDTAVLYYKFISPEWNEHQYDVMISVRTPDILNRYQVKHWLHGPPWAQSRLEYDGSITVLCEKLPRRNFLEIRALYPPETFPQAPQLEGFVEDSISQEESFWADEANARRQEWEQKKIVQEKFHKIGRWLIPMLSALLFAIWIMLFLRFGKRPLVENQGDILAEAPDETPPALVGYLMNARTITGPCLIATIMDLAAKGILEFKHEEFERKPGKYKQEYSFLLIRDVYNDSREKLQDYETDLIDFLFDEIAEDDDILDIKKLKKKQSKFMKFFSKWKKTLATNAKNRDWFDRGSVKGGNISLIISLLFILLSGLGFIWFGTQMFILAGTSFVVMLLSLAIPHHSLEGRIKYFEWKAFRKYLQKEKFRAESNDIVLNKINKLFIFGSLFGVRKKYFKELGETIPASEHRHYVPWYALHSSRGNTFSPESFGTAISSMLSTAGSAMSSASGAGGGASGGGGGGAGSGGGGAG